jgi:hypothetical protein
MHTDLAYFCLTFGIRGWTRLSREERGLTGSTTIRGVTYIELQVWRGDASDGDGHIWQQCVDSLWVWVFYRIGGMRGTTSTTGGVYCVATGVIQARQGCVDSGLLHTRSDDEGRQPVRSTIRWGLKASEPRGRGGEQETPVDATAGRWGRAGNSGRPSEIRAGRTPSWGEQQARLEEKPAARTGNRLARRRDGAGGRMRRGRAGEAVCSTRASQAQQQEGRASGTRRWPPWLGEAG